eukprot:scaffold825_cov147-Cylindrotheca_fusiformis.AAC.2
METPSSARRQALRRADEGNSIRISNEVPLERYYDISKRLLFQFQDAFDHRRLDEAYVYGVRFASLCVDAIPKHASHSQKRFMRQQKETRQKCDRVLQLLDIVRQRMDAEEILHQRAAEEERKRQALEEQKLKQLQQQEQQEAEEAERRLEEERQREKLVLAQEEQQGDVKNSALAKLSAMQKNLISASPINQESSPKQTKKKASASEKEKNATSKKPKRSSRLAKNTKQEVKNPVSRGSPGKAKSPKQVRQSSSPAAVAERKKGNASSKKSTSSEPRGTKEKKENSHPPAGKTKSSKQVQQSQPAEAEKETVNGTSKKSTSSQPTSTREKTLNSDPPVKPKSSKRAAAKGKVNTKSKKPTSSQPASSEAKGENLENGEDQMQHTGAVEKESDNLNVETDVASPEEPGTSGVSSSDSPPVVIKKSPRRLEEERTIELLQASIDKQEKRVREVEQKLVPQLLQKAKKEHSTAKKCKDSNEKALHHKAALHCVAKKRRLERQVEATKGAIFQMETQMFLLENAMEDRQVTDAMNEATEAMQSLQDSVGISDLDHLSELLATPQATATQIGDDESEQELMEELEEWLDGSTSKGKSMETNATSKEEFGDDVSILSLPQVPKPDKKAVPRRKKKEKQDRKLLKAVL